MTLLTNPKVREAFNLLAVAHDNLSAALTTTAALTDAVGDAEQAVIDALDRLTAENELLKNAVLSANDDRDAAQLATAREEIQQLSDELRVRSER